jgi:conjugative transfer signal peptidase TraF
MQLGLLVVATLGAAALAFPVAAGSARLVWNTTASAPAGLYTIDRERWGLGDRVAVLPSKDLAVDLAARGVLPNGKLLIKRVVAGVGDSVCRVGRTVFVNDEAVAQAQSNDSTGEPLPSWQGCASLNEGQVFLLGDTAGSYDGRYFGVTRASEIVGRAALMLSF